MPRKKQDEEGGEQAQEPGKGAKMDVRVQGTPEQTRAAIETLTEPESAPGQPPESDEEAREEQSREERDRDRKIEKLLADPKNIVVVRRVIPRKWNGVECAGEVTRYECPASIDDIAREVFGRFGGRKFKLGIHAASSAGTGRMIDAVVIENPETDEPLNDGERYERYDPTAVPVGDPRARQFGINFDPTAMESTDPMVVTEEALKQQAKMLKQRLTVHQLRQSMADLQQDIDGNGRGRARGDEEGKAEIAALQNQIAESQLRAQFTEKIGEVNRAVEKMAESLAAPKEDKTLPLFMQMISTAQQQAQQQFATMVGLMMQQAQKSQETMTALVTEMVKRPNPEEKFDTMLERLGQMKAVLGGDADKSKRIEDLMYDLALDRIGGGAGPGDEGDVLKLAIKELAPILKNIVESKTAEKPGIGREERQALYQAAAREVAGELVARQRLAQAQAQAQLPMVQHPQPPPPVPPPPPPPVPVPTPPPPVNPQPQESEQGEEEEVDVPPGPQSPAYDRKTNVNFILDAVIGEVEDRVPFDNPDESFVVGDCLDLLDEELLTSLLRVTDGSGLEVWLALHGDAQKIAAIKKAGDAYPVVRSWLTRIVVTVQGEFQRQLASAQRKK